MKKKKDQVILDTFFSLVLLLFLRCNPRFPFAYKRGSRAPKLEEKRTYEI